MFKQPYSFQEWTPENELLSSIGKLCRPALIRHYEPKFSEIAASMSSHYSDGTLSFHYFLGIHFIQSQMKRMKV